MRDTFARTLYEIAKVEPRLSIVVADISPAASMAPYREEFPDRFINVGVAEQSMISLCSGMAMRGMLPFAYTIAPFAIYRPFEHVRVELCYQNLPVTLVGVGAGTVYSVLGGTHNAIEDIAVMSALPNMSIVAPCDPDELVPAVWACVRHEGPLYLRLGKSGEATLTANAPQAFEFGKVRCIKDGENVCVLGYGPILRFAFEAAAQLEAEGRPTPAIFSVHTLKPLDADGIAAILSQFSRVVVIEDHSPIGGLGGKVKEIAWDHGSSCEIRHLSLKDEFVHVYGTDVELLEAHGLSTDALVQALRGA
jgi:transketolase